LSALEKWAIEQGKVLIEMKANLSIIKDTLQDKKETKDLLQDNINKGEELSDGRENSINRDAKREQDDIDSTEFNKEQDKLLCPWVKRVELPTFEGNGP